MNILYIGRFQPFHTGHADAVNQIITQHPDATLFIGIGSAEDNFTPNNPLTAGERFEIIIKAMNELNIPSDKYHIVPIRNINHYALWPDHVQQYLPKIDAIATGSSIVKEIWSSKNPDTQIITLEKNTDICASQIRSDFTKYSRHLLSSTQDFLENINFNARLKNISDS